MKPPHPRPVINRACSLFLTLFFCLGLLFAAGGNLVQVEAQAPVFVWNLEMRVPAPAGAVSAQAVDAALLELQSGLAERLAGEAVTYATDVQMGADGAPYFAFSMQGGAGSDQLRRVLFEDLRERVSLLAGSAELVVRGNAAAGQTLALVLDRNPSTGYDWDWSGLDPQQVQVSGQPLVSNLRRRVGAPETITLPLTAAADGSLELRLAYRRSWEAATESSLRLTIQTDSLPAQIDLSDPQRPQDMDISAPAAAALAETTDTLPASYDWRLQGVQTPVKNQGGCGSCWAFSTIGVLESAIVRNGGPVYDGSEQFLINCNTNGDSCDGGWFSHEYHYNTRAAAQVDIGSVVETALPYAAKNGTCTLNYSKDYRLTGWSYVAGYSVPTVTQIKQAILDHGPVGAAVCVGSGWYSYTGGVYSHDDLPACGSSGINHAIVLLGWDDATQTWLLKNSWGAGWGEAGYMHIRWNTSNIGYGTNYVMMEDQLGTPTLTSPAAGALVTDLMPTFTWQPVDGADGYRIQAASDSGFIDMVFQASTTLTSFTPDAALPDNTLLYWRVQAYQGALSGDWTGARSLKTAPLTPQPVSPDGGMVDSLRPALAWSTAGSAARFDVQISTASTFSPLTVSSSSTASPYIPTLDLARGGQYYWRVRAVGSYGSSAWSSTAAFTTPNPPNPPLLSSPASAVIIAPSSHPLLRWTAATTGGTASGYQLQFSHAASFAAPFFDTEVSAVSYLVEDALQQNALYYWRVRAFNGDPRIYSSWTAARYFKTLPDMPAGLVPAAGTTVDSLRPTFGWQAVTGTASYDIQVGQTSACGSLLKSATLSTPTYTPTTDLPRSKKLYWRVRTRGAHGISAWTACSAFITPNPPAIPAVLAPVTGSTLPLSAPFRPTLRWKASGGTTAGYVVQLANNTAFSAAWEVRVEGAAVTSLTWDSDLPYGTYYWRLRSYAAGPVYSSWGSTRSFRTQSALSGLISEPSLGLPVANATLTLVGTNITTTTGPDGRYRLPVAPPGTRVLSVSAAGYASLSKSVVIAAGREVTANLTMSKLTGRLLQDWH